MSNRFNGFLSQNPRPDPLWLRLAPVAMAFVGTWFGFANPLLHIPPAVLLLPAALLLVASRATSLTQALRQGLLTALPGYAASLYWLAIPVHDQGGLPWTLALPCPVLVGALLAAYCALFCAGLFLIRFRLRHPLALIFSGTLWASLELGRNYILTGFPWLTLSSAFAPWPPVIGLAAWIGAFGLSGLFVALIHALALSQGGKKILALPLAALCLAPILIQPQTPTGYVSLAMIQGNIDQSQKWDQNMQARTLEIYLRLSRKAARTYHPDLIIWPETAVPFYFQDASDLSTTMRLGIAEAGVPVLAGVPAYSVPQGPDAAPYVLHNRASLLDNKGAIESWYDKEHLVPFGEYVPLGKWLPFITKLVPGQFEFQPGRNMSLLHQGPLALGMLICYEAIFPELAQNQVALGANVLVNISNDAWFGRSSAPKQHLDLAVLRAVEQNRTLVRGTNTGISAIIGPGGDIRQATALFSTQIVADAKIALLTGTTFYHDHFYTVHAAFILTCLLLLILLTGKARHT